MVDHSAVNSPGKSKRRMVGEGLVVKEATVEYSDGDQIEEQILEKEKSSQA